MPGRFQSWAWIASVGVSWRWDPFAPKDAYRIPADASSPATSGAASVAATGAVEVAGAVVTATAAAGLDRRRRAGTAAPGRRPAPRGRLRAQ